MENFPIYDTKLTLDQWKETSRLAKEACFKLIQLHNSIQSSATDKMVKDFLVMAGKLEKRMLAEHPQHVSVF